MAYEVNFSGASLSDFCTVLNVKRSVLPSRTNYTKSIPSMNGSYYTGFHYAERIISLDVFLKGSTKAEYIKNVRGLANLLNVANPSKLIISDEPDKYVYAVLDGSTDLERSVKTGTTTITFICHNPVIYTDNWNTFQPNSRKVITVDNTGSIETSPLIEVDFMKKACFFQATNREGETVLIGTPKQIGKTTTSQSDIVVNDNCQSSSTFTTLSPSLLDNDKKVDGGTFGVGFNGNGIVTTNFGNGEGWHGSAFRKSLGKNVSEFEVEIDFTFSSQGKNYVPPAPQPPVPPPKPQPTPPPPQSLGTYKVVNCGGLWINQDPNTSRPLYAMAPGTYIYPTEIKNGWAKHTHSNKWNTFTGWSSMKYLQKVSNNGRSRVATVSMESRASEYAENQLGVLGIYGFDASGAKLFKTEIADTSEWFEQVEPKMYISTTKVLEETAINKTVRKDGEGNNQASGAVGKWNDCNGKLIVRREKNSKGEYLWNFKLCKYVDGKLTETLQTKNSLISSSYPKGDLNYLGFYIGSYGNKDAVSVMAVTNVKVKKLNLLADATVNNNLTLFEPGDHLQIDFEGGEVTLNGVSIASEIDIGSMFFDVPVGQSELMVRSDDDTMIVCCGVREKFI